MAACLRNNTSSCINKDDGEVGSGAASYHVSCVLLVSRSVGDDELAQVCREVAISHIDGDAFLALSLQSVEQQGIVNLASSSVANAL